MSKTKPYTLEEIEGIRASAEHRVGSPEEEHHGADNRWLTTLDARDAEIAAHIESHNAYVDSEAEATKAAVALAVAAKDSEIIRLRECLREIQNAAGLLRAQTFLAYSAVSPPIASRILHEPATKAALDNVLDALSKIESALASKP